MGYPEYSQTYDSGSQFLEELLEVKSSSVCGIMNLVEESENKFVFCIKTEGACSHENISYISSSLPGISIKGEKSVKFGDVFRREDWVFGGNILGEDSFEFFFLDFSF